MASDRHLKLAQKVYVECPIKIIGDFETSALVRHIAEALAQAEREGMRRAAEIARNRAEHHRDKCEPSCKCADGFHVAGEILSQAGEDDS